jgi:hypothetical protein
MLLNHFAALLLEVRSGDIRFEKAEGCRLTGDIPTWYTSKPSEYAAKSHSNR